MSTELEKVFIEYKESVSSLSQRVAILPGKKRHLGDLVRDIEESSEFHTLVQATRDEFGNTGNYRNESAWHNAVRNVLRRSGFYTNIFEKKLHDLSEEFEKYVNAFTSPQRKISYLAPLEYVSFRQSYSERQSDIDCGYFQIKSFSRDELYAVLGNSVNKIFYPWAVVDLDQILDYWFIYVQQVIEVTEIIPPNNHEFKIDLSDDSYSRVKMTYTPQSFPEPLESIIKLLALFDWPTSYGWGEAVESATGWNRFNIPFVLTVTDSLYESPSLPPRLERLWKEPIFDGMTGEESREKYPVLLVSLDERETESLMEFVKRTHENLKKLDYEKSEWHFLGVALNMLIKAFFTEGLEQLLWHITAIDALLGERGGGLTNKLARRIAAILGETGEKQQELGNRFIALYDFRSELVHGREFNSQIHSGHLREARDFARQTLIWFLNKLATIQDEIIESTSDSEYPARESILEEIDGKSCWKPSRHKR